jgi:hypothetical protein
MDQVQDVNDYYKINDVCNSIDIHQHDTQAMIH